MSIDRTWIRDCTRQGQQAPERFWKAIIINFYHNFDSNYYLRNTILSRQNLDVLDTVTCYHCAQLHVSLLNSFARQQRTFAERYRVKPRRHTGYVLTFSQFWRRIIQSEYAQCALRPCEMYGNKAAYLIDYGRNDDDYPQPSLTVRIAYAKSVQARKA